MCWAEQDASPALCSHCLDPCKVWLGFPCWHFSHKRHQKVLDSSPTHVLLSSGSIMVYSSTATHNSGNPGFGPASPSFCPVPASLGHPAGLSPCTALQNKFQRLFALLVCQGKTGAKSGSKVVLHLLFISATAECSWPSLPQHIHQAKLSADAADMQLQPSPPILLNSSCRQLSLYVLQSVGDRRGCMPALSPTSICRQLLCSLCMGWAVGVCSRAQRMESAPVAR